MKTSDWIADYLVQRGVRHVFMVTGGGAMHLNDSFGKHPGLKYVCFHHEQACAPWLRRATRGSRADCLWCA